MAKFSGNVTTKGSRLTPVMATTPAVTFEGGEGFSRDAKSDLFLLAVTNMVGEDTFYEASSTRDTRFESLVHQVTSEDPAWMQRFIPWLRTEANMRSAAIVAALEYARAGGPNARQVIAATATRADEPMELLGYWLSHYGRKIPASVKRGIADASVKLFNEKSFVKYDGQGRDVRVGDVIELTHPKPKGQWQSDLFKFAVDRRHRGTDAVPAESLSVIRATRALDGLSTDELRSRFEADSSLFDGTAYTWERLAGKTKMDGKSWDAIIPSMGAMALVRNLRNFDEAGISKASETAVKAKLTNQEDIKASRQLPFRFYTAFKNVGSVRWSETLETALGFTTQNVPEFPGRTLVLVDTSGSMDDPVSYRSTVARWELGAVFAGVLATKNADGIDLVSFGTDSEALKFNRGDSVLNFVQRVNAARGRVGHGTEMWRATAKHFDGHDRVVIFTDVQTRDSRRGYGYRDSQGEAALPVNTAIHGFNLGGYEVTAFESGKGRQFEYGGFSDSTFKLMLNLESLGHGEWPF